jgi:hypothetical protein
MGKLTPRNLEPTTVALLGLYVALVAIPIVYAATTVNVFSVRYAYFWAALVVVIGLVTALLRRRRWAWLVLLVFEASVLISFAWDWAGIPNFVLVVVRVAILTSPHVRHYVGSPGRARKTGPASPIAH